MATPDYASGLGNARNRAANSSKVDGYDYLIKLLIIGAAGGGKSCLLHRLVDSNFRDYSYHTIGVEFGSKIISVNKRRVKVQIWDTAGQERFRSVTQSYYRGAAGALLVYDITSHESFQAVTEWLKNVRSIAGPKISIVLVGHKSDLNAERQVPDDLAIQFAENHDIHYIEASSKTGENVDEAFKICAQKIISRIDNGEIDLSNTSSGVQHGKGGQRGNESNSDQQSVSISGSSQSNDSSVGSCFSCS